VGFGVDQQQRGGSCGLPFFLKKKKLIFLTGNFLLLGDIDNIWYFERGY
jgi:hypothetical protein